MANESKSVFKGILLTGICIGLLLGGLGCKKVDKEALARAQPLTLKVWGVFDDSDSFNSIFNDYRTLHPYVSIEYRKFRYDEYADEILDALAEDQGPDIMFLHDTWMREWQPRLLPAPSSVSLAFIEVKGGLKKERIVTLKSLPVLTQSQLKNNFVDAVAADAIIPTEQSDPRLPLVPQIYGLPMSVDTMVLYYNRDLLNAAGIAQPPTYWKDFQEDVKLLTKLDETGAIIQSGAAIGTSANVERADDILALLMMQNGTAMTDSDGVATFDRYTTETQGQDLPPGAVALVFYNDFANPTKEVYTWNANMPDSLQAFADGRTAFFFGYQYHLEQIRQLNPKLNFGISSMPQIEGNKPMNYANYWLAAASKKTEHPDEAWDLLQFMTKAEEAQKYVQTAKKPTALRSLVNSQLEDLDLAVFAAQVTTARTWYRGTDAAATEEAMLEMIDSMLEGDADPKRIVELGATKVNQTVK
jgi:multiple sugar transport system substrate-binding protein